MQCWFVLLIPLLVMLRRPTQGISMLLVLVGVSIIYTAGKTFSLGATPTALVLAQYTKGVS